VQEWLARFVTENTSALPKNLATVTGAQEYATVVQVILVEIVRYALDLISRMELAAFLSYSVPGTAVQLESATIGQENANAFPIVLGQIVPH
jgi:hypothetical protein